MKRGAEGANEGKRSKTETGIFGHERNRRRRDRYGRSRAYVSDLSTQTHPAKRGNGRNLSGELAWPADCGCSKVQTTDSRCSQGHFPEFG